MYPLLNKYFRKEGKKNEGENKKNKKKDESRFGQIFPIYKIPSGIYSRSVSWERISQPLSTSFEIDLSFNVINLKTG